VYAVVAYNVAARRTEMAVRLAVGATPRALTGMVVRQGSVPIAAGIIVGLAGSAAAARSLRALLFGITPQDPPTYLAAGLALLVVALLSCWWPARRAARVSPIDSLRA
jgi:putative ABC transport system permease protein